MRFPLVPTLALAAPLLSVAPVAAQSAPPLRDVIVPHRAVYEISLARSDEGSGVSSAKGRMVFEITGSACEGYRMRQRMVVNLGDEEGNPGLLDFRITTFESGDGGLYTFDSRTTFNEDEIEAVAGEARRQADAIEVKLREPTEKTIRLDGDALFPSQHMQAILDAAAAEQRFVAAEIYEGAGTGEESDAASASIGPAASSGPAGALRTGVRHWPILVGYFDGESSSAKEFGEETPSYQMSFTLYENGVTNDLVMDYGDYALSGSLDSIEALDVSDCPQP
ncbi:MAG TPA: cell envelope integrity EipB family protein [Afifellaceae bacterium]|nr:cell envelope integrity EipB family protein [Afifellaceae bacterium]